MASKHFFSKRPCSNCISEGLKPIEVEPIATHIHLLLTAPRRVRPYGPKPYEFTKLGDIHGPKPYKFIGFGNPKARSESGKISLLPARIRQKIGIRRCRSRPEERPEALSCSLVVLRFSRFGWSQSPCVGFQRAETFLWICGRL